MASLLIELPRTSLQEREGAFDDKQVRQIVSKHLADGFYPLIRYYDRSTEILHLDPGNQFIKVTWLDVGADEYKMVYGLSPDVLDQEVIVLGNLTMTTLINLDNNKLYFISVSAIIDGEISFPSRIAIAVPFDLATVKGPVTYGVDLYGEGIYSTP